MKRTTLLFLIAMISVTSYAQGIKFQKGSWKEVLEIAQARRQVIFVDAWATWCGPCKAMKRNTFPDPEVGSFFNANFLNVEIDVDKQPAFSSRYAITQLPTLLFINHKGDVIHRVVGYKDPSELIAQGRKALSPDKNLPLLKLKYQAGTQDPPTLLLYATLLAGKGRDYQEVADAYFATQIDRELLSEDNWEAIKLLVHEPDSREFQYLLKKKKKFVKNFGSAEVEDKIFGICHALVLGAAGSNDRSGYEKALSISNKYLPDEDQKASARLRMVYAEAREDWPDYAFRTLDYFGKRKITNAAELNRAAGNFATHIADKDQLVTALDWSRQSVAIENSYEGNYIYARLLFELGHYGDAARKANKAISIANLDRSDAEAAEKLLQQIRGKRE